MNIFTANQVNQVYVLKPNSTIVDELDATHQITAANNLGSVGLGVTKNGKDIYFKHVGAGGVTRSDLIEVANVLDIEATPASKMGRNMVAAKVTLNTEALDDSKPIAGEDYILRLKFQNPVGMSPDNQYWKYGVVHATSSMSVSNFYAKLALSIAKNMSREAVELVKVYVVDSNSDETLVTPNASLTGTYTSILIKEVEQDWILGVKQQKPVLFTVEPTWVNNGTDDVIWGDVVYSNKVKTTGGANPETTTVASGQPASAGAIVNSKLMADFEYFYMGERGDQYRMVGYPDYVPTEYLVDPTWQYGYDTVAIHFAYVGANHSVQKSEKDITFIVPRASTDSTPSALGAKASALYNAILKQLPSWYEG